MQTHESSFCYFQFGKIVKVRNFIGQFEPQKLHHASVTNGLMLDQQADWPLNTNTLITTEPFPMRYNCKSKLFHWPTSDPRDLILINSFSKNTRQTGIFTFN